MRESVLMKTIWLMLVGMVYGDMQHMKGIRIYKLDHQHTDYHIMLIFVNRPSRSRTEEVIGDK